MSTADDAGRWQQIKSLFQDAIDREPTERAAFLTDACGDDAALRAEVESLLAAHETSPGILDTMRIELPAPAFDLDGAIIGPYRISRMLGQGGMGAVYLGHRIDDFDQRVAIKIVAPGIGHSHIVDRFRAERQTLANLNHPNIARLLDGGTAADGVPYFVMDFVEGVPIDRYCDLHELSTAARLRLFRVVCSAVQYAHQNLVVHRDIKPDNILVSPDGVPKLLDFGIAKVLGPEDPTPAWAETQIRGALMTPGYASPEQVRAEPITTASDVYSLGILLFKLLTGALPYRLERATVDEIARATCDQEPDVPSRFPGLPPALRRGLAGDLDAIVLRALRKEPERRYGSVEALSEDIARHLDGLPVLARRGALSYRIGKFVRRHRAAVTAAAAGILILIGAVVLTTWQARVAARERDRATSEAAKTLQINAFLREMLGSADPYVDGRTVTVAQTLERAAARIDLTLADQPEIAAAVRATIGTTYTNLGLVDAAIPLLQRALAERRLALGNDHPDVARNLDDLAYAVLETGDVDRAVTLYQESLALYKKRGLADDLRVIPVLNGLGRIAANKGEDAAAEAWHRQALGIARRAPGGERYVAESLNNLAVIRQARADLAEAETLFREAVTIIRRLRGAESPELATGLSNLSGVLLSQRKLAEAEDLSERALAMRRTVLGNDHPDVAFALFNHADLMEQTGRYADAIGLSKEVLVRRGTTLPDGHPMVAAAMLVLGRSLTRQGDPAAGEPHIREALRLRRDALPPGHWLIANTESTLGGCLVALGRLREAEPLLIDSYERLRVDRGEQHERTVDALTRLITLYERAARPDRVAFYQQRLARPEADLP